MDTRGHIGRIVAVGGGKGGVGKSLISTNLAVSLASSGARVVMLDADLGAPNLHTMFGIMRPPRTVEDFLAGRSAALHEVAIPTSVPGLRLICGAEGALGSAQTTPEAKQRLFSELARLDADCLVIDVGAGVNLDLNIANRATVGFGAKYMYILDVGDISSVDWYGPGRASGFGLDGNFVIPLPKQLYLRGSLAYQKFSIEYDGVGQITEDEGVSTSSDSTVKGNLDVGIQF